MLCVLYVLDILQTVDQNVDPCDDFFLHACGGWIKNNPIPPNEPLWNQVLVLKTKNDQVLRTLLGDRRIRERYLTVSQISLIGFTSIQQCTKLPLYTFFLRIYSTNVCWNIFCGHSPASFCHSAKEIAWQWTGLWTVFS